MKQLLQNMKDGKTLVAEVPVPGIRPRMALVRNQFSLVSAGTERMLVEFAEKSLVGKASSRPDLVRQVITKARREGLIPTIEAAFNRLDQPMALGYSSAGVIIETGEGLTGFKPGDRVACAGGGFAVHAEYVVVPQNLLIHLPENVDFESAAFTTLGGIAMQGFRLAQPQVGESVCVIGLGLLGLLTIQIARAAGCQVFGIDLDPARVQLAEKMGFNAATRAEGADMVAGFTQGRGFDHVLICADTSSNDPVELAGQIARDRGVVVAVGAVGMEIPRKIYYEKELDFKISRSYGPGRYDHAYEEKGQDYPLGYVRWTEGRNLESFVALIANNKVDVKPLITHQFPIDNAADAYQLITGKISEAFLGVLLTYPQEVVPPSGLSRKVVYSESKSEGINQIRVGVLGAGNYAQAVFLPVIKKTGNAEMTGIASASGLSATHAAKKFGFTYASSSEEEILDDPNINTVVVLTRHQHHARQVVTALQNQKSVYCEKPLALTPDELTEIHKALETAKGSILTVGFNRRFAPLAVKLKNFFQNRSEPMSIQYTVNAGFLPLNHWLHDTKQGGGRIIGEGCHFIDFLTFLTGSSPTSVSAAAMSDHGKYQQDNVVLTFSYSDGSIGTVAYLANGNKNYQKERVEVFCAGKIGILDDFRNLKLISEANRKTYKSRFGQDKGHAAAWRTFIDALTQGETPPIPYEQLFGVTQASFAAVEALKQDKKINL